MKKRLLMGIVLWLLLSAGLACAPTGGKPTPVAPTATRPVSAPTATQPVTRPSATQAPGAEFADIPIYPGAVPAPEEARLVEELKAFGTLRKNEVIRVFTVPDLLDNVLAFYKAQMPQRGWQVELDFSVPGQGGVIQWQKAQWVAVVLIGEMEGKRLLLIDRAERAAPVTTAVAPTGRVYAGPDVSRDGLDLTGLAVEGPERVKVGDKLTVRFTLRNTTAQEMVLKPYGILVGCRDPENANRDFGHREVTLPAGASYDFSASIQVDKAGLWHFWPGYYLGHWGPSRWQEILVQVE